jgi:membrane protein DedA with SNARE-associated domain
MTVNEIAGMVTSGVQTGMFGLLLLGFAEKAVPLIPSYAVFVLIGMAASENQLNPITVSIAVAIGSMIGSLGWYCVGRALGFKRSQRLIARYGRLIWLTTARYDRIAAAYQRNLLWTTLVSQTVPAVRVYMAIPAGVFGLPLRPFACGVLVGSFVWCTPLLLLGYHVGNTRTEPVSAAIWLILALIGAECSIMLIGHSALRIYRWYARPVDRSANIDKLNSKNESRVGSRMNH